VIGVLRPTIVLPERFAGRQEPRDRVEAVLRHEWAHIRNGDLALLALLRGLLPFLFAHPAYWWLRRRVRADQEAMADARAVRDGDRLGYAEALLDWARATPPGIRRSRPGSLALWDRPSELRERIALLLGPPAPVEGRCPRLWRALIVSTAAAVVLPLAGLSMAGLVGAELASAVPPHDCDGCEHHAPAPAIAPFSNPSDAPLVAKSSRTASAPG
jgi:beta-lactamase regulating signal transducer with metallopeptidase domain